MIKFWAALLVVSTWHIVTYAQTDDTVVKHESFLKKQESFRAKRARIAERAKARNPEALEQQEVCETKLAEVVEFPPEAIFYGDDPDAIALAEAVKADFLAREQTPTAPKKETKASLKDASGLGLSLRFLRETIRTPMDTTILRMKKAALDKFSNRMAARIGKDQYFLSGELHQYSELLTLAMRGIFYGSKPGENPIANTTVYFKQQHQNFPTQEKYHLAAAVLRGVDLIKAVLADEDFMMLIEYWFSKHAGPEGLKSPVKNFDAAIQRKINQAAEQDVRFNRYVVTEDARTRTAN